MTKPLIFGLSALVSTLAGSYAAMLWDASASKKADTPPKVDIEFVKLEPVSVPVVRGGRIDGYVIARSTVAVVAEDAKKNKAMLTVYASESVFRAIYEENLDFAALKQIEIAGLAARITALANERIGRQAVMQTAIESVNFVDRSDARLSMGSKGE